MAFYELRQYKVRPARWIVGQDHGGGDHPVPGLKGMVITGSYRGETDDS